MDGVINSDNIVKLDTVAIFKDFGTVKDIKDLIIDFKAFIKTIQKQCINNQYKTVIKYTLLENIKANIYGLEKLELKQVIIENDKNEIINFYKPKVLIMFNSKLLQNDYLKGLNKNNIDTALNNLIFPLEKIIKLSKRIILNNFEIGYIDFTENIIIDSQYTIFDYLKSIEYSTEIKRGLKNINTRFQSQGTLYFDLSYNGTYKIYDKHKDITDTINARKNTVNKRFYNEYTDLIAKSNNILRFEVRIFNKKHRLNKKLGFSSSEKISLNKILNQNINIPFSELLKYSDRENTKYFDDKVKNNKKDFFNFLLGDAINRLYIEKPNGLIELKNDIFKYWKNRKSQYNNLKKAMNSVKIYLSKLDKPINYYQIFNDILYKLSIA